RPRLSLRQRIAVVRELAFLGLPIPAFDVQDDVGLLQGLAQSTELGTPRIRVKGLVAGVSPETRREKGAELLLRRVALLSRLSHAKVLDVLVSNRNVVTI